MSHTTSDTSNTDSHTKASGSYDLVLGTAGHIDHGKSSLIKALTGTDPDRLSEEKRRGITITLGFARIDLPDGRSMGVVDVPGHERFVKQMIAGASGIDVALLVIAADDGIMPQTIEHVAVLQTLGVRTCIVALTKIDMVDAEWVTFMKGEVESWLASTSYAGCPIVPVSSKTGEGLDELRAALQKAAEKTQRVHQGSTTRLPVDRVFTIKGAGTVITGTLWDGTVSPEDTLEILPSGKLARVRSVQVHGQTCDEASAGMRVALNLSNIKKDEINLGDFLAAPGCLHMTDRFDARITYLDVAKTGKPLKTGTRMHLAHGTREVLARVLLCNDIEQIASGQSALAQIRLEEDLPISWGDRFILRTYSPVSVAGGGQVLLAHPHRRSTLDAEEMKLIEASETGDIRQMVERVCSLAAGPLHTSEVARLIGISPAQAAEYLADLTQAGALTSSHSGSAASQSSAPTKSPTSSVPLPADDALFIAKNKKQQAIAAIERELIAFCADHPHERGITKEALHAQIAPHISDEGFEALLNWAVKAKSAVITGNVVGHPSSQQGAAVAEEKAAEQIHQALIAEGMTPRPIERILESCDLDASLAHRALAHLESNGKAIRIARDLYFDAATLDERIALVQQWISQHGAGTVAELKEPLGTSRKYAVPLLEHLDAQGITVREGDKRSLRPRR